MVNRKRIRILKAGSDTAGPVVYWMSRDQRVEDNWALLFAQEQAIERKVSLLVLFTLAPQFLDATYRQYIFMIEGLKIVEQNLTRKNIPFFLLDGKPYEEVIRFIRNHRAGLLVTDFSPLKIHREWKESVTKSITIPFYEVDAHNIVPCWVISGKQEYGAYTIRPKIQKLLLEFLDEYPNVEKHPYQMDLRSYKTDWNKAIRSLRVNREIERVDWLTAGKNSGKKKLDIFLEVRLKKYAAMRNDPTENAQSDLSPYLHFGHISAQQIALEVQRYSRFIKSSETFLEELIVRRELSDNYCLYNPHYDSLEGIPRWAKETLKTHRRDKREYLYNADEFEQAVTHDQLWNAAQREMVRTGKMHGYMRMYWAKKILEWSKSPDEAMQTAIYLNDTYELDGRDPNGYAGIAWSIGGVHDRPWFDRPVYGKVRSMTFGGCKKKFDVDRYISMNRE